MLNGTTPKIQLPKFNTENEDPKIIVGFPLTTVIPKTRTKAKEPRPITTTAIAQSGMPPTSSGAAAGAGSGLATT